MSALISAISYQLSAIRKLIILSLILIISSLLLATPIQAQVATPAANIQPLGIVSYQSPQYVNLQVINLLHSVSCILVGISPINQPCIGYQAQKNTQGSLNMIPMLSSLDTSGGVLGTAAGGLALLSSNPPIKTIDYLGSVGKSLNFWETPTAHAQVGGSGSQVLSPVLELWKVSRNIAYLTMIIIFVVIGVMVMFRNKINPQTVMTLQAALPGLVVGLILITFSYFLAALLTDMAFVGTNLVGHYFTIAQEPITKRSISDLPGPVDNLQNENVLSIMAKFLATPTKEIFIETFRTIYSSLPPIPPGPGGILPNLGNLDSPTRILTYVIIGLTSQIVNLLLPNILGTGATATLAANALRDGPSAGALLVYLILIMILIYSMFKILQRLITSYLTIIWLTISAPFTFLMAAFPGKQDVAMNWGRNMLANVLAFPGVLAMFYFAAYLMGPWFLRSLTPPPGPLPILPCPPIPPTPTLPLDCLLNIRTQLGISGSQNLPLLGGLDQSALQFILAYGALIAAPAIPEIITNAIGKASPAGQMIGREVSGAIQSGRGYLQQGAGAVGGVFRGNRR